MKLQTKILSASLMALIGMFIVSLIGLVNMRQGLLEERRSQIVQFMEFARATLEFYQKQVSEGKLTEAEAKTRAAQVLSAQRGSNQDAYYIARAEDNTMIVHKDEKRIGKVDDGGRLPNGQLLVDSYAAELKASSSWFAVFNTSVKRATPGNPDARSNKMMGIFKDPQWKWTVNIGFLSKDIEEVFWHRAYILIGLSLALGALIAFICWRVVRNVMNQLGGEPDHAATIAKAIADGDLTSNFNGKLTPNSLMESMHSMQSGLLEIAKDFNHASQSLATAVGELTEETNQISKGSQLTSEATSATAAAVEQMTVSINQISDGARQTEVNSEQSALLAKEGEKQAFEAVSEIKHISTEIESTTQLMHRLVEQSREIDQMSAVIKEIAEQTNLLALNAAIEAARAGEQGRGFAVVADEVRKLAERTSGTTLQITQTIHAIQTDTQNASASMDAVQTHIQDGVTLVEKAAESLHSINESTQSTLVKIREVANAAHEQSQASNNIAGNIERIAQMVEESEASVKGAHMQVEQMNELAMELQSAAGKFRC